MASDIELTKQRSDPSTKLSDGEGPLTEQPSYVRSDSRQSSHAKLARQQSRDSRSVTSRPKLDRLSSFDLHHVNSVPSKPDLKRLGSINLNEVPWWTSQRVQLSLLCFLGFLVLYAQRVNLSIAIVSMVRHEAHVPPPVRNVTGGNVTVVDDVVYGLAANGSAAPRSSEDPDCPELKKEDKEGEFNWSKQLQGLILGAFFWGYLILQVPGGVISEKFGPKRVVAYGMFPVAVLSLLSPVCARANPYLFLVLRVLLGVGEGVMYPAAQALWSQWAPPNERSRLIGFSYAGGQFGNAIIFPIGGYLSAYGFDGGWPSVFYVLGICGFLWCVAWVLLASDTPEDNRRISAVEKKYIQYSLGERMRGARSVAIPWKAIFTSRAMWAIIVVHMCGNYGAYMLLTQIPTYMKEVLKFDIKANGVFSMLPYLVFWLFITISGMLADFLISRQFMSVAATRKLMAAIGTVGPGCFLIGTGFMQCDQQVEAVVMLTVAVGLCGFHFSGYFINHGDIAPAFAGTLFGISNMAATVPGIIAPYVVSALTVQGKQEEWQVAFYIAAAIYFFGAVFFAILGQGEVQPWAKVKAKEEEDEGGVEEQGVGFGLDIQDTVPEEEDEEEEEAKAAAKMLRMESSNNTGPV